MQHFNNWGHTPTMEVMRETKEHDLAIHPLEIKPSKLIKQKKIDKGVEKSLVAF